MRTLFVYFLHNNRIRIKSQQQTLTTNKQQLDKCQTIHELSAYLIEPRIWNLLNVRAADHFTSNQLKKVTKQKLQMKTQIIYRSNANGGTKMDTPKKIGTEREKNYVGLDETHTEKNSEMQSKNNKNEGKI